MAARSSIEWTEATWNPTTGCDRVSAGCENCYALTLAKRLKGMGNPKYQNDGDLRTSGPGFAITEHANSLALPHTWATPRVIFVNSMSDLFHSRVSTDFIKQVFQVMADTPRHTYQLLTKRPSRVGRLAGALSWPENIWMGVSVESMHQVWRVDELRRTPAAVRFISAEPLLGSLAHLDMEGVDWLIVGGESGPGHRPMRPAWVRELRASAERQEVPFFFKQWGGRTPKAQGRELDGRHHNGMPTPRARVKQALSASR